MSQIYRQHSSAPDWLEATHSEPIGFLRSDWSPTTRLIAGVAGCGLVIYGATRKLPAACVLGTLGLGLIGRAVANSAFAGRAEDRLSRHETGEMPMTSNFAAGQGGNGPLRASERDEPSKVLDALQFELRTTGCEIPRDERIRMQPWLVGVAERIEPAPGSSLGLHVAFHPSSAVFNAEFTFRANGRRLFVREKDPYLDVALDRGFTRLQRKLETLHFHGKQSRELDRQSDPATIENQIDAFTDPERGPLAEAVSSGDYRSFRTKIEVFDEWLNRRVGRLLQRWPEAESAIGETFLVSDVVEDVYLNAFEQFATWPRDVPLREWLEGLVEPAVRHMLASDEENEAVSFARSLTENKEL